MTLKFLSDLLEIAKTKPLRTMAVASAEDKPVLEAVKKVLQENIINPVLIGNVRNIKEVCEQIKFDISGIELMPEPDPAEASIKAVKMVREGKADILMKGLVPTAVLLKAILDKDIGLRKGDTLSHFAYFESPYYHKLLGLTDAAMNISPDLNEKIAIINNAVEVLHRLGNNCPKVAVIGPLEVVNSKIESTVHGAKLAEMNKKGKIKGCLVDGPLAFDIAISKEAAEHKNIKGVVAGDADILITPDLNCGNILYKSMNFLGGGTSAAVIMGASAPIVLTSRADSEQSKMMSIVLAAAME